LLPWNDSFCPRCGQPVVTQAPPGVTCVDCQRRPPLFHKARSPLRYDFPVDRALKRLKFRGQTFYAPALAGLLLPVLRGDFSGCDGLIPVPLHRWRHFRRGFNQAHELCRTLASRTGLPIIMAAVRVRATSSQSGLSAAARRRNLHGAFAVRGKLHCRHPLIVDDVVTTGATCEQLARALRLAGAAKVGVLTVARSAVTA
jgi:ComF family protein